MTAPLPAPFADLESVAATWSLATETERNRRRLSSTLEELQAMSETILPRLDEIFKYLEPYPLDQLPADAERLFLLTLSLAEIAPALECYGQPAVIDGLDSARMPAVENFKLTPYP